MGWVMYIKEIKMDPVAISLGTLQIRWYGIMAALGFITALFIINRKKAYAHITTEQLSDLMTLVIFAGIAGARALYVLQNWSMFSNNPAEIIRIDHGGLVFYGGFLCAIAVMIVYCVRKKISVVKMMDITAPGLAFGHGLGRLGCFINGCCFGKPTSLPWGHVYPEGTLPSQCYHAAPLHPVQLYETFGDLIIFAILFYYVGRLKKGMIFSIYIILYGTLRFLDEFLRGDHTEFLFGLFTPAQSIGLVLIPVGIGLLIYFKKQQNDK